MVTESVSRRLLACMAKRLIVYSAGNLGIMPSSLADRLSSMHEIAGKIDDQGQEERHER